MSSSPRSPRSTSRVGSSVSTTRCVSTRPPRSGRIQEFPELDRAEWVDLDRAGVLLTKGQRPILAALSVSGTD